MPIFHYIHCFTCSLKFSFKCIKRIVKEGYYTEIWILVMILFLFGKDLSMYISINPYVWISTHEYQHMLTNISFMGVCICLCVRLFTCFYAIICMRVLACEYVYLLWHSLILLIQNISEFIWFSFLHIRSIPKLLNRRGKS